ncbi:hypothetical protein TNCV_3503811 [Trichonephila clavipes]|uniref:Uncharacterized protein n=1 Tax=Trichonephila clavipes TaxID=2585209 RepID=A0A8X6S130_TRICX|nr:hypothetical protein TNCV_3503811 [Trichonephila clavipes]
MSRDHMIEHNNAFVRRELFYREHNVHLGAPFTPHGSKNYFFACVEPLLVVIDPRGRSGSLLVSPGLTTHTRGVNASRRTKAMAIRSPGSRLLLKVSVVHLKGEEVHLGLRKPRFDPEFGYEWPCIGWSNVKRDDLLVGALTLLLLLQRKTALLMRVCLSCGPNGSSDIGGC